MARKKNDDAADPQELNFEQAIAELEEINRRIEEGTISLDESLAAYRRGIALAKRCNSILDTADQEVKTLNLRDKKGDESK